MDLKLHSPPGEEVLSVATAGRITARELVGSLDRNPLQDLLGRAWAQRKVALDMAETDFVDSAAVGWLIQTHRDLQRAGGAMVLHSIRPTVMQMFQLLKVGQAIPLRNNEQAARALLCGDRP